MEVEGIRGKENLRRKGKNFEIKCFAFINNLVLLAQNCEKCLCSYIKLPTNRAVSYKKVENMGLERGKCVEAKYGNLKDQKSLIWKNGSNLMDVKTKTNEESFNWPTC